MWASFRLEACAICEQAREDRDIFFVFVQQGRYVVCAKRSDCKSRLWCLARCSVQKRLRGAERFGDKSRICERFGGNMIERKDDAIQRREREKMVKEQLMRRGVQDERVLEAMWRVPRHLFTPAEEVGSAYADRPVPLGPLQTISQPYMVALMSQAAKLPVGSSRVLEIGTGSGYSAAVLAEMGAEVYTIEIVRELAEQAASRLEAMGYKQIHVRAGDGALGWSDAAPFDAILVTAAPPELPSSLGSQLRDGGQMIIPVGLAPDQSLLRVTRRGDLFEEEHLCAVRFVPMVGSVQPWRV